MQTETVEESIIRGIRANNDRILSDLYRSHFNTISKFVIANSGTTDEAKDVYQEAFITLYNRIQKPDFVLTCRIGTYLYAVSRRLWLKRLAGKKRVSLNIHDVEEFVGIEEEVTCIEDEQKKMLIMTSSIERLGQPCATIITDYYVNDLTMDQISEKFGYTNADNAKNQKYKCLQRLKKIFFEAYKTDK